MGKSQGKGRFLRGKGFGSRTRAMVSVTIMLMLLFTVVLSGCSKSTETETTMKPAESQAASAAPATDVPATEAPKEIVELKAFFPGDTPQGFEEVMKAVNDKLKMDNIGAALNINFVSWNDYGNLTNVKTAAGEDFDMFLDAPWLHLNQMIASQSIIPLDDLVAKAPDLVNSIPQQMWDSNKYIDKIYGIPLGITQGTIGGFIIRKDLRVKYGMSEIKSLDDMEKFLYAVKKNEKDIIPFGIDSRNTPGNMRLFNPLFNGANEYYQIGLDDFYNATKDGKVIPAYEVPGFAETTKKLTQYYKDGIFEKNIAQEQNTITLFNQGKVASAGYSADGVVGMQYADAMKIPGVELEIAIINPDQKRSSDYKQWNFLVVPKSSKHAQQVIDVMNWLSKKENHDLLEYGIEGKNWTPVGDDKYKVVEGSKYSFPGYVMTWRPNLARTPDTILPDDLKWYTIARDANAYSPSPFIGFVPDTDPIKTEYAKISPLKDQVYGPLGSGVLTSEKGLASLKTQTEKAGSATIIETIQKQINDFLAKKAQ